MKAFALVAPIFAALAGCATPTIPLDQPIALPLRPLLSAKQQICTETKASGLGIKQLKAGEGASPLPGDMVMVHYLGYLRSNGAVFDQSSQAVFPVDGVIQGFAEGIMQMNKGAIYRLCIPAALGYGAEGTPDGTVPGNADLGFQVELVDFKSPADIEAMQNADAAAEPEPAAAETPPQNP